MCTFTVLGETNGYYTVQSLNTTSGENGRLTFTCADAAYCPLLDGGQITVQNSAGDSYQQFDGLGQLTTQAGDSTYSHAHKILHGPWHGWKFDIHTGQAWVDPTKIRVRSYEVSLATGTDLSGDTIQTNDVKVHDTEPSERQKGPHVAETYTVSIEEQHLVVGYRR